MDKISCNYCGSNKFSTNKHLQRHIKHEHIQTFEYKCLHCAFTSVYLDNTKRHMQNKHMIEKKQEEDHYVVQDRQVIKEYIVDLNQYQPLQDSESGISGIFQSSGQSVNLDVEQYQSAQLPERGTTSVKTDDIETSGVFQSSGQTVRWNVGQYQTSDADSSIIPQSPQEKVNQIIEQSVPLGAESLAVQKSLDGQSVPLRTELPQANCVNCSTVI